VRAAYGRAMRLELAFLRPHAPTAGRTFTGTLHRLLGRAGRDP
jgi:hypothetical protein